MMDQIDNLALSTIRQNRGISLEQISTSTKISVRLLEAIEQGDFAKLPGGIYNTSYIRQYARAIDYDETSLLAVYHREMERINPGASSQNPPKGGNYTGFRSPSGVLGLQ